MKVIKFDSFIEIKGNDYFLRYNFLRPLYIELVFDNGIRTDLFIASGCDRDEMIDQIIRIDEPEILEYSNKVHISFKGITTLWEKTIYVFECSSDFITYHYKVQGNGVLDNAMFFEGFLKNDPKMDELLYPYFCGPGRHKSYHRPVKWFMQSSSPGFDIVYSFSINSSDKRECMYYENATIRVNGDRHNLGGDWLTTPPPFLYLLGKRDKKNWISIGLLVSPGKANFLSYDYSGGEGFGLNLNYDGMTVIKDQWESPGVIFQSNKSDVYKSLENYIAYLSDNGLLPQNNRTEIPDWWKKPIFGGWGEQVFHSNRWNCYFSGKFDDWKEDNVDKLCTQQAYENMLIKLEKRKIDPTILIVDNRWFSLDSHLKVDNELWPDMKGFIANQHKKNERLFFGYHHGVIAGQPGVKMFL